jgi:hypothetical protein
MKNENSNLVDYYLYYCFAVNIFRVFMYIVAKDSVTSVKISPEAWKNKGIQEVAHAYTNVIRIFMCFRAAVTLWATYLPDTTQKRLLCSIIFIFDFYMALMIFSPEKENAVALRSQNNRKPVKIIQASIVVAGVIFHFCWLVLRN